MVSGIFHLMNSVIEIHSRTNAIGMPIQDNANDIHMISMNIKEIINLGSFQNNSRMSTSYNSNDWDRQSIDLNGQRGCYRNKNNDNRLVDSGNPFNKCYDVHEYRIKKCVLHSYMSSDLPIICNFFTFYWTPDKDDQTCLTMTYYTKSESYDDVNNPFVITMTVNDENNNMLIPSTVLEQYDGITTLKITNIDFKNNQEYKLSLQLTATDSSSAQHFYQYFKFGIKRIAQCSNYDGEDVRIISVDHISGKIPKPFNILGNSIVQPSNYLGPCLNGGYIINQSSKCVCPPGFKGKFCETGCGVNSFGSDCKGVCSIQTDMCRGMFMCTSYGCTCTPGLTGPSCNEDCTMGTYGADCRQTCSDHCLNNMCDKYTGGCNYGCSVGYIPPYCSEKYHYLIEPPTLRFANFDAIEIELDFQENNIKGGDKIIKPKYYQLFYKSLIENTFRNSEIKPISNTNNVTLEVIRDLESDTKYTFGVLLIADDGNFNEQNMVYGQYKTPCMQPQINDYNIKLMSGIQSINITWSISISNRLECNITKYVLTLMSNQSQKQKSDEQELILPSTDSGHVLDNLLPGFKYNIKLTPSTSNGTLPSSPIYSITTLMTKNDVQIKNISTKYENGKIKLNWILVNKNLNYATVDVPVTAIIKYKVKRILSCSLREVEQNWTSITVFNRTNYEIYDPMPNSQYSIQVLVDIKNKNTTQQENMFDVLTPASSPITEPILDPDHPMCITNNSIFVQWKFDPENCSKLNGFLSQFYIELKDKVADILEIRETKNNYVSFNELKSNTAYELKVFIKTHFGYNPDHFLLTNFKTKFENLKPVEDLVVYKKSLKNHMAGIRWRYSQDTNVDGFIVLFDENPLINTKNVSIIPPQNCSAWPEYYCHTFYNLSKTSNNYIFKIMPKSIDYPEGGKFSSIYFNNSIDELPDSPMNLKTTEIGSATIVLQWDIPWILNGELEMFIIKIEEISSMGTCCVGITDIRISVNEELPTYNHTITGLHPGSTYLIGVSAMSSLVSTTSKSSWYDLPSRLSVTLPTI
ncbi:unnamed protein product [Macrosiphum euphorbiae]|uniref:Uncharacterized protein n=1 Tax=Macrosiphum euphorbiae TaxID=13131 RepID=A0AAV0WAE9_9HEMI|nr:unnamed protein product [Macrosiphum euphorbiae]